MAAVRLFSRGPKVPMADLDDVYNSKILEAAAAMPRTKRLAAPDATASARAKLCGSTINDRHQDRAAIASPISVRACRRACSGRQRRRSWAARSWNKCPGVPQRCGHDAFHVEGWWPGSNRALGRPRTTGAGHGLPPPPRLDAARIRCGGGRAGSTRRRQHFDGPPTQTCRLVRKVAIVARDP